MKMTVKTKGFRELDQALTAEIPKATAKNVLRRAATNALKPVESKARGLAPKGDGGLAASITTKAVKAKRASRTRFAAQSGVTVATGPTSRKPDGPGGNAAWQEFGTATMPANAYMRPAYDSEKDGILETLRDELGTQIEKARQRIARKAAKGK